jgi:hypothetical protein
MQDIESYWQLMQDKVCSHCIDGGNSGGCRIDQGRECALRKYLPQILDVVNSVYSPAIEPYEVQLRNKICGICIHQSVAGKCAVRNEVECALDRYFPLIVEVIEESQSRNRQGNTNRT